MATERTPAMNEPTLIRGSYTVKLNGKDVVREYAYTAVRSTLFDADLIAWAEHRAAELKRERA